MAKAKKAVPTAYKAVVGGSKQKATMKATGLAVVAVLVVGAVIAGSIAAFRHTSTDTKKPTTTTKPVVADNTSPSADTDQQNLVKSSVTPVTNAVLNTHSYASVGQYLTDPNGRTLYTYGADTSGVSKCTGSCVQNWPIYEDTGATVGLPTDVGTIKRTDTGTYQYTYKGLPLYYYIGDSDGQVTDGLDNFHAARL